MWHLKEQPQDLLQDFLCFIDLFIMVSGLSQNRREKKNKWLKLNLHQQKTTKRTKNAHKHIAQLDMTRDSMQRRVNTESNKTEKSSDRNVRDNILLYFSCLYDIIIWFLLIRFHVVKKRKCPMSTLLNPICFFFEGKKSNEKKLSIFLFAEKLFNFCCMSIFDKCAAMVSTAWSHYNKKKQT